MKLRIVLCGCIFLIMGACAGPYDEAGRYYASETYPARSIEQVQVLETPPTAHYSIIADFQARNATSKDMQKMAAKIGADAVIVSRFGGYRALGDHWAGEDTQKKYYDRIAGTAIRYQK